MKKNNTIICPCKNIKCMKSHECNCCNPGTCLLVPVSLHNICKNRHLLVIVEVFKDNKLYAREIKKIFTGSEKENCHDHDDCHKKHDCDDCNKHNDCNDCKKHHDCNDCNKHHNCNDCNKHHDCNDCNKHNDCNDCNKHHDQCNRPCCDNLIDCLFIGDFKFYFLCDFTPVCISVDVKTQYIYCN